jgi:hypothetical protein
MERGREEHVRAHNTASRTARMDAERTIGTHEHAEELRQLAREGELRHLRNTRDLDTAGHPGQISDKDVRYGAGTAQLPSAAMPAHVMALHRAADMIDRGQPSLARAHSGTIRTAAGQEQYGDRDFARRLGDAADKLEQLPKHQGYAAQPRQTKDSAAREAATQEYVRRSSRSSLDPIVGVEI